MKEELKKCMNEFLSCNDKAREKQLYQRIVELISELN